jgi:hypothetical protein
MSGYITLSSGLQLSKLESRTERERKREREVKTLYTRLYSAVTAAQVANQINTRRVGLEFGKKMIYTRTTWKWQWESTWS